ncbi:MULTISPECIES: sensor histidine kinase [unclassified Frondihabitans]|uniref:sensor histidine kinase n=1 Tax=unclassified Frondihabitans TaxID=2626248 RepID=UPI000F4E6902|nr:MULTISPECIES: sensor histidine kinase [unclassified Frondihabitans]RPE78160.1 histidine kinase/DNA gyrase B/HSP90-like ATPase [Frondihabitans sp. PhB153]RPF08441.1 histidine kinase/DNA gyrase B/HSP90-like ATPase [Frondihabitans sp. PhB161]
MNGNRWWHTLFAVTMAVLTTIALSNLFQGHGDEICALAAVALLIVAYVTLGRRGFSDERLGRGFAVVLVLCSGVAVSADASMAIIQCIAMPLMWILLPRIRDAVIGNAVLALVIGAAMSWSLRRESGGVVQSILTEALSFAGSLALGLWISRIAELSEERARLLDELRAAEAQVEALGRQAGITSERERWARDIHDTIAQSLTGLVMLGQRAQRELAAAAPRPSGPSGPLSETLHLLEDTAREALAETRSLVAATAPVDLGAGITAALERLGARFERETGVAVGVVAEPDTAHPEHRSARDSDVVLLRCAQEALANVRKHSAASAVEMRLTETAGHVSLTIRDDGRGFDATQPLAGFGLNGMRERVSLVGGHVEIESLVGDGTIVSVTLPDVAEASASGRPAPLRAGVTA